MLSTRFTRIPDRRRALPRWLWLAGCLGGLLLSVYLWPQDQPIQHPPGVLVKEAPTQERLEEARPIQHGAYRLMPVSSFTMTGRVLGALRYDDAQSRLAPYDLAVGWGPMSDTAILDQYALWQEARAYRWDSDTDPLITREVIRHSTNIHLIPANADVAAQLPRLRPGHLVELSGRLVDATHTDGARWRTSRSRTDAGYGACELLWVETLSIRDR